MRKRNIGTALAAAAMVLQLVGTAGPAHAVDPVVEFNFSPTNGPAGTKVTFTDKNAHGCPHVDARPGGDGFASLTLSGAPVAGPVSFVSDVAGAFSVQVDTAGLAPGQYIPVVGCLSGGGAVGAPFTVNPAPLISSTYVPLTPARVLDTRNGTGAAMNPLGPGGSINVKVTEVAGVPANATAVALNVVATNASGPASFLTVWPTSEARPVASNLNFTSGVSVPNMVIARIGTGGNVSFYNNLGSVNVAADVQGYFVGDATGSSYNSLPPARVLDTRNGTGGTLAPVGAGGTIELKVTDAGGVPAAGGTAVALNVTATNVSGAESFLTIWPSGSSRPVASNLNFIAGQTVPNLVIVKVGDGGKVAIYNNVGTVDVVADTQGYFAATGSTYFAENPQRILDSRNGTGTGGAIGQLGQGNTLDVQVTGVGGVPANATAVALNVTVADSPGPDSFLTVYPAGTTRPLASNLNFVAGQTIPNLVIAKIGTNGKVTLYNNLGSTVVIADVQGYFTTPPAPVVA